MKSIFFSLKMLFKDFKKNLFYIGTLISLVVTNFLFNNMISNPSFKGNKGNLYFGNFIVVIIIIFAMVLSVYAYSYLMIKKSLEIQLFKLLGSSTKKMSVYLIIQNVFMILTSYIIGVIISILINPISNYIVFHYIGIESNYFSIYTEAFVVSLQITIIIFLLTSFYGMGYVSRQQIIDINDNNMIEIRSNTSFHLPLFVSIFLYVSGILMFVFSEDITYGAVAFSGIGCIGAIGLVKTGLYNIIKKYSNKKILNKITLVSHSNLAFSLKNSYIIISGMLFSSTVMLAGAISNLGDRGSKEEFIVSMFAYIISVFIFALSVFFKYIIDLSKRTKEMSILYKIGYSLNEIKYVLYDEILKFYMIIFILSIVYIFLILIHPIVNHRVQPMFAFGIICYFIVILCIVMCFTYITVEKKVITYINQN